jgi:rubrerythrin
MRAGEEGRSAMTAIEAQLNHAILLQGCEEAISRLYKEYARAFPEHRAAWQRLASDEIQHADWLHTLRARIEDGSVHLSDAHLVSARQVLDAQDRVGAETMRVEQGNVSVADAFRVALGLEGEMLEQDWFRFFDTDSPELKRVFQSLAAETAKHAQTLRELLETATHPHQT